MPGQGCIPMRSVRVPDDVWRRAQDRAWRRGETLSDVIRQALRRYAEGELMTEGRDWTAGLGDD